MEERLLPADRETLDGTRYHLYPNNASILVSGGTMVFRRLQAVLFACALAYGASAFGAVGARAADSVERAAAGSQDEEGRLKPWRGGQMDRYGDATQDTGERQTGSANPILPPSVQDILNNPALRQELQQEANNPNTKPEVREHLRQILDGKTPSTHRPAASTEGVEYRRPAGYDNVRRSKYKSRELTREEEKEKEKGPPSTTDLIRKPVNLPGGTSLPTPDSRPVDLHNTPAAAPEGTRFFNRGGGAPGAAISGGGAMGPSSIGDSGGSGGGRSLRNANRVGGGPLRPPSVPTKKPASSAQRAKAKAHLDAAKTSLQDGDAAEALSSAEKAVQLAPDSADARFWRGVAHEQMGNHAKKMSDLEAAARMNPNRYRKHLQAAREGRKIFKASGGDSAHLLDGFQAPVSSKDSGGFGALWILLGLPILAAMVTGAWMLLRSPGTDAAPEKPGVLSGILSEFKEVSETDATVTQLAEAPLHLEEGVLLAEKYRLSKLIGRDGRIDIWKAHDTTLDRPALVKRIHSGSQGSEEREEKLSKARAAATLHHPNVTDIYEVLDLPSGLFVVYEYTSGKSLRKVLRERGSLPSRQVRDILTPVCRALEHAHHRGIAHGGLTPDRIVITGQGYIQVMDFLLGHAKGAGREVYQAPEARGGEAGPVSDIYSLGVCFYEMLTGDLPEKDSEDADPRVREILERTLDPEPDSRLDSARDFLALLRELIEPADDDRNARGTTETAA